MIGDVQVAMRVARNPHPPAVSATVTGRRERDMHTPSFTIPERVTAAFDFFDENRNGHIDARELRKVLKHYGLDTTVPGAEHVLAAYDEDPDRELDLEEFRTVRLPTLPDIPPLPRARAPKRLRVHTPVHFCVHKRYRSTHAHTHGPGTEGY